VFRGGLKGVFTKNEIIQILLLFPFKFFFLSRGAQHPSGSENPLKSVDFNGPERGGYTHYPPPPEYASEQTHFTK